MLPASAHVRDVYEGAVLGAARPGTLLIDCSTIDPAVSRALSAAAAARRLRMVDAPVSGGVGGAQAGTLTFMVGGSADDFAAVRPLLAAMGKSIVHCGAAGAGQIAKLCNNLVLGVSMNAVAEAMNLGVRLGADAKTLAAIINSSSGRCWSSDTCVRRGTFPGGREGRRAGIPEIVGAVTPGWGVGGVGRAFAQTSCDSPVIQPPPAHPTPPSPTPSTTHHPRSATATIRARASCRTCPRRGATRADSAARSWPRTSAWRWTPPSQSARRCRRPRRRTRCVRMHTSSG